MTSLATRSYCCYYHPRPDAPAESGVLPSIRLQAADADSAARLAYATLNLPIDRVERIDPPLERRAANDGRQLDDATRNLLVRRAIVQRDRCFTGDAITGFGALA